MNLNLNFKSQRPIRTEIINLGKGNQDKKVGLSCSNECIAVVWSVARFLKIQNCDFWVKNGPRFILLIALIVDRFHEVILLFDTTSGQFKRRINNCPGVKNIHVDNETCFAVNGSGKKNFQNFRSP